MQTIQPTPLAISIASRAAEAAATNWSRNLEALAALQPRLIEQLQRQQLELEWVYARDGSLTSLERSERWYEGCSLPREAARFMLQSMEGGGNVACFLSPVHAAQLRVGLDLLRPHQAIIAIVPHWRAIQMILRCEDFSADFASHRLWFACGDLWTQDLESVFREHEGLPTPTQFIRPITADSGPLDQLIAPAQRVFAEESSRRASFIQSLREQRRRTSAEVRKVCVIAPSQFRLWDNAGVALAHALRAPANSFDIRVLDPDDPLQSSPVALARPLVDADALITADRARGDLAGIAADDLPWVTWVTKGRVPPFNAAGPRDALLVVDPEWKRQAVEAGWPEERVEVIGWPAAGRPLQPDGASRALAIIADTRPLDPPPRVTEYSSHRLLWDRIRHELNTDPFVLDGDPVRFLQERMAPKQISEEGFDKPFFVDALITPAYQQGLARALLGEGLPVRLYGTGWATVPDLSEVHGGEVRSQEALREILHVCAAVVHVWPWLQTHPVDGSGRPVLRRVNCSRASFFKNARALLQPQKPEETSAAPAASANFAVALKHLLRNPISCD